MQSVSFRVWTRVAVSIPHHDIHYTTGTSNIAFYRQNFFSVITKLFRVFSLNPSYIAELHTRTIFKRSAAVLNSYFSFSYAGCLTKGKEHSLPDYLSIIKVGRKRSTPLRKVKEWNKAFDFELPILFPATITTALYVFFRVISGCFIIWCLFVLTIICLNKEKYFFSFKYAL